MRFKSYIRFAKFITAGKCPHVVPSLQVRHLTNVLYQVVVSGEQCDAPRRALFSGAHGAISNRSHTKSLKADSLP